MKSVLLFVMASLLAGTAAAENLELESAFRQHEKTESPDDARYALIQAPYTAKATILLDRYTGITRQAIHSPKTGLFWREIKCMQRKDDRVQDTNCPNYQVFISRLGLKFTTLLNVRTGAAWILLESKEGELFWQAILDEGSGTKTESSSLPPPPKSFELPPGWTLVPDPEPKKQ